MRCLICSTPDHGRPGQNTSDFEALFGSLVRSLAHHWWLIDGGGYSPWSWPSDWYADDDRLDAINAQLEYLLGPNERALASSDFFNRHMRYLSDFWIDVYAFPKRPQAIARVRRWHVPSLPQMVEFPEEATHVFVNVDGAYWALLSEDDVALSAIAASWPQSEIRDAESREDAE